MQYFYNDAKNVCVVVARLIRFHARWNDTIVFNHEFKSEKFKMHLY